MIDSVSLRFGPAYRPPGTPPQPELEGIAVEFPTVALAAGPALQATGQAMQATGETGDDRAGADRAGADRAPAGALTIDLDRWRSGEVDFYGFDARVDARAAHGTVQLRVVGARAPHALLPPAVETAMEVLTRCQRWVGRRNASSCGPLFDRVLALHRQIHDLAKPLVRADHAHALDVWQWLLRLDPHAGLAVQIAALFHDCERLVSEADERIEHKIGHTLGHEPTHEIGHQGDRAGRNRRVGPGDRHGHGSAYDAFKQAHARGSARMARALLGTLGVDDELRARVAHLIACHDQPERPGQAGHARMRDRDPDLALLEDADGLSFFSLNSAGFLDYYGPAHTRRKIAWTLARMGPEARARLRWVRLRADVARLARDIGR